MQQEPKIISLDTDSLVDCYEIRETLIVNSFGIIYKAWDTKHKRLVLIKEYFPTGISVRADNSNIINPNKNKRDDFQYGLDQFLDEANALSKFHHPNIISVQNYLQANNTGYQCIPSIQGQTLTQKLVQHNPATLPEKDLIVLLKAIVSGLQYIHEQNYYHFNISPNNLYIRERSDPALINFGSAQRAIAARLKKLPSIACSGYTPNEQYGNNLSKLGPWTDLYALGAVLYKCISGHDPVNAKIRHNKIFNKKLADPLIPATTIGHGLYSKDLLSLTDWMLAPAIIDRPQNTAEILFKLNQNPLVFADKQTNTANVFPKISTRSIDTKTKPQSFENIIKKPVALAPETQSAEIKPQIASTINDEAITTHLLPQSEDTVQQSFESIIESTNTPDIDTQSTDIKQQKESITVNESDTPGHGNESIETQIQNTSFSIEKTAAIDLISQPIINKPASDPFIYWFSFFLISIIIVAIGINQKQNLQQLAAFITNKTPETIAYDTANQKPLVKNKIEIDGPSSKIKRQQKLEQLKQQALAKHLSIKTLQEIKVILDKATSDIKQLRLTSPKGNNALEKYLHVLQLQPKNKQAKLGMFKISDKYLELSNKHLLKQNFLKAKQFLEKAKTIEPGNPNISEVEKKLKSVQKNRQNKPLNKKNNKVAILKKAIPKSTVQKSTKSPVKIEMIWVNSGCFNMGDNAIYATEHKVCLTSGYFIGKHEVTQALWQQIMGNNPSIFKGDNNPVENISWNEVQTFIRKLNLKTNQKYRLPTEAEWEYACLSGGKKKNYCGSNNADSVAWHKDNSDNSVHPVGQKEANSLGIYDMSGNVWEWVQDGYASAYYNNSPINNPQGPAKALGHVVRGGSWFSGTNVLRSAYRVWYGSNVRVSYLGFRLSKS